jgi:hypothetical protein
LALNPTNGFESHTRALDLDPQLRQLSRHPGVDQRGPFGVPQQDGVNDAFLALEVHAQLESFDVLRDLHKRFGARMLNNTSRCRN